jgi:peptide/nickel transport system substrate-binding protein
MKRSRLASLALLASAVAIAQMFAATARPRYGGMLRVESDVAITSLAQALQASSSRDQSARSALLSLVFETLVTIDASDNLQPLLAISWRHDTGARRWDFRLRPGILLHDGTALTPAMAAAALGQADASWTVQPTDEGVSIDTEVDVPDLPWEIADERHAIAVPPSPDALPAGTGPFRVAGFDPGRRIVLEANDAYWGGRPFLDVIQVSMGRALREQAVDLELGRAEVVSLLPQDVRRISQRGFLAARSRPNQVMALVFDPGRPASSSGQLRTALALAIDRTAICTVLLQREAEPAAALIPAWLGGYASFFSTQVDREAARSIALRLPATLRALTLGYPASDPLAQAIAERAAVDARDAGISLNLQAEPGGSTRSVADIRLVRMSVEAPTAAAALLQLSSLFAVGRLPVPDDLRSPGSLEAAFGFEQSVLERHLVIPLVHIADIYGLSPRLHDSNGPVVLPSGRLDLADSWLLPEEP